MLTLTQSTFAFFVSASENDDEPQQPVAPPKLSAAGRKKFDDEDVEDEVKVRLFLNPKI